ncbi:UNVERIFIED_CONTAM: hypothetical protein Slati_2884500 [Sesamum latifolium]|uniref:Retrovirus-related Pol polyprotein from transposon TNT 1-94-like beta-barrel domain-containing protein n=1 Tax=Sesamum latifolium TaxID=2727402 RepID=A0AAW2VG26_9LAMI
MTNGQPFWLWPTCKIKGLQRKNSQVSGYDSGASHHMIGNKHLLMDLVDILPSPIGLPNRTCTNAVKKGSVILGDKLRLDHVLYVPQLSCNLISLASIINDLHCFVTLTDKLCVIQDRISRTLIGVGKQKDGIYLLSYEAPVKSYHTSATSNYQLWHRRLGHASS